MKGSLTGRRSSQCLLPPNSVEASSEGADWAKMLVVVVVVFVGAVTILLLLRYCWCRLARCSQDTRRRQPENFTMEVVFLSRRPHGLRIVAFVPHTHTKISVHMIVHRVR